MKATRSRLLDGMEVEATDFECIGEKEVFWVMSSVASSFKCQVDIVKGISFKSFSPKIKTGQNCK